MHRINRCRCLGNEGGPGFKRARRAPHYAGVFLPNKKAGSNWTHDGCERASIPIRDNNLIDRMWGEAASPPKCRHPIRCSVQAWLSPPSLNILACRSSRVFFAFFSFFDITGINTWFI